MFKAGRIGLSVRSPFIYKNELFLLNIKRFHTSLKTTQKINHQLKGLYRQKLQQAADDRHERARFKNRTAAYYTASVIVIFLAAGFAAVPLYRALCQRTGWGGTPITDSKRFTPDKLVPVDTNKRIRIQFTCQASGILPWKFTPQQ